MKILDRYIAKQYLLNVVVLVVILFSFIVVIDMSLHLHRFSRVADQLASADGQEPGAIRKTVVLVLLVADLWWPKLFQLFNFIIGMVLVAAMGFTCAQLVRHRELIAILASGDSLRRIARPVLIVALGITALQAINQEFILPRIAPLLQRDHDDAGKRSLGTTKVPVIADSAGHWFYAAEFDAQTDTLHNVYIWETDENGLAIRRYAAEHASWIDGGWVFDPPAIVESRRSLDQPPTTADRIESDLDPTSIRMARFEGYATSLSTRQISQLMGNTRRMDPDSAETSTKLASLQRIRLGRYSIMISNLLVLIICLPFFLTRVPHNMVAQSLKCAPIAVGGLLAGVLGSAIAIPGVPASLGVFLPAMILVPIAIATTSSTRT